MNTLTHENRCAVIRCLVDGRSIRATTRMTGVAKNTIQKLTRELGEAVAQYSDNVPRNIKAQRVQYDEVCCFCYAKDKNLPVFQKGRNAWLQPGADFSCHNCVRIHQTLRVTPATKAGITDHKWSVEEMVNLLPEVTHPSRGAKKSN